MNVLSEYLVQVLKEGAGNGNQTHIEHPEDLVYDGHEGVGAADAHLRMFHNHLLGAKRNVPDRVETKVDGSPAVHIFKDNEGRIGVGTKSIFNRNPKLNFTEEDIEKNHSDTPELVPIMKQVLTHAHKMVPANMKPGEIYKGDFLFGDGSAGKEIDTENGFHSYQPNTLRYKVPVESAEGARVANAKIGISMHTFFGRDGIPGPIDKKRRESLLDHPDVYNYNPLLNVNPLNHTPEDQRDFESHMENARKAYNKIKPEVYDNLTGHDQNMRMYTNSRVREGGEGPGNVDDYLDFLNMKSKKDIARVKMPETKERKSKEHAALMQQVIQNSKHVQNIFDLHHYLQQAKNTLVRVADKNSDELIELPNGESTTHEGYVSSKGPDQVKFVNRNVFSKNNFSYRNPMKEAIDRVSKDILKESVNRNNKANHHLVWGRMNPIHAGHEMIVGAASQAASVDNGSVSVVLSATQDRNRNPLSPEQKLKHARRAFPGVQVSIADSSSPTILHQAAKLHSNGVRNLTVHVGSDRADVFDNLLNSYNGVKGKSHGYYAFNQIKVIPVGEERNSNANGVPGVSASKMRKAAIESDEQMFNTLAPSNMNPKHRQELYQDVQSGLTSKESLSNYLFNKLISPED